MEWYMTSSKEKGGYNDGYKNLQSREEIEKQQLILRHKRKLTQYWEKIVKEKNLIPQKEGAKLRKHWLYGGTRRIKWSNEDKKDSNASEEKWNKAASLTEDSCFWAQLEEALIAVKELRDGVLNNNKGDIKKGLEQFEAYLMLSIKNFSVSPDIFLEGSSLMKWWKEYEACKENLHASDFAKDEVQNRFQKESMASFVQPSKVKINTGPVKNSFVSVLKSNDHKGSPPSDSSAIVMDDSCIILIEACSVASKEKMLNHEGLASWFSELCIADPSFVSEDRLVWISIEGLPFNTWNNNAYAKIISQWGTLSKVDTTPDSSSSAKKI
ncbi:senescence-associated carboxylesterase 101-like protein, partial [Tanacetum coccineum]